MKSILLTTILLSILIFSCKEKNHTNLPQAEAVPIFKNKGHKLVSKMVEKVGDYNMLLENKDVVYTYSYQTPDGKKDVSTEKYLFNGELSYGSYHQHERTFPELEGLIEQGFDGKEYWLKHNGEILSDSLKLKRVAFNRPTNFYWFAMFQKLLDPGLHYEYLGESNINNIVYDMVKITFQSDNDKPTDIYQIFINKNTLLVDQFLFTVADFGVIETPFLMQLQYEEVNGMLIPTKRQYKKSTWNAEVTEEPWINVSWSNITFNNNLNKEDFKK